MTRELRESPLKPSGPSFGLALGGGGARGLAHIHVFKALDEMGVRPVAISGTSIGAILGAAYAAGLSGQAIEDHARSVLKSRREIMRRVWQAKPMSIASAWKRGTALAQFDVERIIQAFMPAGMPSRFEELKTPLIVTATDFYGHRQHTMEHGDLVSALGASAAIPAVFLPVNRDDLLLIDGGFYNPVPYDLLEGRADVIIAIDVIGAPEAQGPRHPSPFDLMYGSSQLMMQSMMARMLAAHRPEIYLRPPVSRFRVLDFTKYDQVMGTTQSIMDDVKRAVDEAMSAQTPA